MSEREAFEAWARSTGTPGVEPQWRSAAALWAWHAWQASAERFARATLPTAAPGVQEVPRG